MPSGPKTLTVLWFAWLRERTGLGEEHVAAPSEVVTVADLIAWLADRGPGHAAALAQLQLVRCAVNQQLVEATARLHAGDEVAFFPPVTGG